MKIKLIVILYLLNVNIVNAQKINTFNIETQSLSAVSSCLGYCIVGICLWLRCTNYGCSVETTLLVSHRVPDLVVSTYKNNGDNQWNEANIISSAIGSALISSVGISGGNSDTDSVMDGSNGSLVFSEVDIFGGLGDDIFITNNYGMLEICEDETTYLRPYYLTKLDYMFWRDSEFENLNPLTHANINVGFWGALYPRVGFIHQAEQPKACAVLAQRALDITTHSNQGHIYTKPDGKSSFWLTDQWQMLYPRKSKVCQPHGLNTEYSTGLGDAGGKYVWNIWRRYDCCVSNPGAILIKKIRSTQVPPQCNY